MPANLPNSGNETPSDHAGESTERARVTTTAEIPSADSSSADSPDRGGGDSSAFAAAAPILRRVILSLVRHGATAAGTALGVKGLADDSIIDQIVGLVMALLGLAFSLRNARNGGAGKGSNSQP